VGNSNCSRGELTMPYLFSIFNTSKLTDLQFDYENLKIPMLRIAGELVNANII
jgi:hypothetical protein